MSALSCALPTAPASADVVLCYVVLCYVLTHPHILRSAHQQAANIMLRASLLLLTKPSLLNVTPQLEFGDDGSYGEVYGLNDVGLSAQPL